ncbi:signal peptidase I [Curtobacterium sp. MCSS17_006]|uniref:signal peptidase I n=1 Tax=Curtobacterium sp. MCSS17_006 TaxID=2175642 RepID=UPI0015E89727|nr:signal peptidase I [Curtobacterium sp. MCSS17_006]
MLAATVPQPSSEDAAAPGRAVGRARSVVLVIAGTVGAACLLAWVAFVLTGLSLVVVTTGSMAPTIPAGGLAVTHDVAAADLHVGDVVTVPRPGSSLPVTHRVVDVAPVPGDTTARSLTLRGDDNATEDRDPYVVRDAGLVVAHAARLGSVLVAVSSPPARGLAVAVVGVLVVWAFWPERPRREAS